MPTNPYVSHSVTSEQNLYEDLIIESIRMYGEDVYYLPRDVVNRDVILNEDIESQFNNSYTVEMYIENIEGFEGEGNLLAKFGLEIRDEATFIVARKKWVEYVGNNEASQIRPEEGDLIYLPLSKSLFEISFVEHEQPFYQLSNLPVYKLQAKLFEYNDEEFNTGVAEIDAIESQYAFTTTLTISGTVGPGFTLNERISQPIGSTGETITGEVVRIDSNLIAVANIETSDNEYHEFTSGATITGLDSGTTGMIAAEPQPLFTENNTTQIQNDAFSIIADPVIDFSESNPFGEII
jgi:hypothetical protein